MKLLIKQNIYRKFSELSSIGSKVYIVPTKLGVMYIAINFIIFLIALTYTNNVILFLNLIIFAFFLMTMFSTHRIIEHFNLSKAHIKSHHVKEPKYIITPVPNRLIELKFYSKQERVFEIIENELKLKRGRHTFNKIQACTRGPFNLFYVWQNFKVSGDFFVYPEIIKTSKTLSKKPINKYGIEDFDDHSKYVNQSMTRINWKLYARSESLLVKDFTEEQEKIKIIFNRRLIDDEQYISQITTIIHNTRRKWEVKIDNTTYSDKEMLFKRLAVI